VEEINPPAFWVALGLGYKERYKTIALVAKWYIYLGE
jgi:hypothetical protein